LNRRLDFTIVFKILEYIDVLIDVRIDFLHEENKIQMVMKEGKIVITRSLEL